MYKTRNNIIPFPELSLINCEIESINSAVESALNLLKYKNDSVLLNNIKGNLLMIKVLIERNQR